MATHSRVLAWRIPVDRGAWWAAVHGVAQSRTGLKRLSGSSSLFLREAPHLPPTQTARLQSPLGPGLLWVLSAEWTSCGGHPLPSWSVLHAVLRVSGLIPAHPHHTREPVLHVCVSIAALHRGSELSLEC